MVPQARAVERKPAATPPDPPRSAELPSTERFERIVDEYQRRLYGFALRMTGNREDAEEIVQDAFVRAFRALGKMDDAATGRAAAATLAVHDHVKRDEEPLAVEASDERSARCARRPRCAAEHNARGSRATRADRRTRDRYGARRAGSVATAHAPARCGDAPVHRRPQSSRDCGNSRTSRSGR